MSEQPKNLSASIRARLLNMARESREDFQYVLTRFANERLLYRLSESVYRDRFILKGASLFILWTGQPHRATRDLDLLSSGDPSPNELRSVFRELCDLSAEDGLVFLTETIIVETLRENEEYRGLRLTMTAMLGNAGIPLQVDIGYGDAVTPAARLIDLPATLNLPSARLRAYPRETVVAEKLHVIVRRGMINSRLKDYYDLWHLCSHFNFDGAILCQAVRATFDRRETEIPAETPIGITGDYTLDPIREEAWRSFLSKNRLYTTEARSLADIGEAIQKFVRPVIISLAKGQLLDRVWDCSLGQWT